jgi:hypothetical protein
MVPATASTEATTPRTPVPVALENSTTTSFAAAPR